MRWRSDRIEEGLLLRECRLPVRYVADNKFFTLRHVTLTKAQAAGLLKDGRVFMKGLYSEKTGKNYTAWVVLDDNGEFVRYRVEFDRREAQ